MGYDQVMNEQDVTRGSRLKMYNRLKNQIFKLALNQQFAKPIFNSCYCKQTIKNAGPLLQSKLSKDQQ